jgi:hypothetical protein
LPCIDVNTNGIEGKELASNLTGYDQLYNLYYSNLEHFYGSTYQDVNRYVNSTETRNALHAGFYDNGSDSYDKLRADIIKSVEPNFTALIDNDYKVLLFVGNLDNIVGVDRVNAMLENPG